MNLRHDGDDEMKQTKDVSLCPFWSLLGRCSNELTDVEANVCILGKHSTIISVELEYNRIAEAKKLSQHILQQLQDINANNSCYNGMLTRKSHSMLLGCVYESLADISIIDQEYQIADEYFDKAYELHPFYYPRIFKQMEMIQYFIPDKHDKMIQLEQCIREQCNSNINPALMFYFAMWLRTCNHFDESINYFKKIIELQPANLAYLREYAFTLYKNGSKFYPQALEIYHKILKMKHCDEKTRGCCQRVIDKINKTGNFDINLQQQQKSDVQTDSSIKQEREAEKKESGNTHIDMSIIGDDLTPYDISGAIKINYDALQWRAWQGQDECRHATQDNIAVIAIGDDLKPCEKEMTKLKQKLVNDGINNESLSDFKLKIYNYNIDNVKKYYTVDRFCHQLCLFGYCVQNYKCGYTHTFSIDKFLSDRETVTIESVKKAIILTNYMLFVYQDNEQLKQKQPYDYTTIMGCICERFADICRVTAQNKNDMIKAEQFYRKSFNLWPNCMDRNLKHARLLNLGLNKWNESKQMFQQTIINAQTQSMSSLAYAHFSYGMVLQYRMCLDESVQHLQKAMELKQSMGGDYSRYVVEYGIVLMKKGPLFYQQALLHLKEGVQLARRNISMNVNPRKSQRIIQNGSRFIDKICNHLYMQQGIENNNTNKLNRDKCYQDKCNKFNFADCNASDEFARFWNDLKFDNEMNKEKYLAKFVECEYNFLSALPYIDEKILYQEIEMNENDCKYFLNQIFKWNIHRHTFVTLLREYRLYDLYFVQLTKFGVYTVESLKYFMNKYPNDWYHKILKANHTKDCFQLDVNQFESLLSVQTNKN